MTAYIKRDGLQVARQLEELVSEEILPGTSVDAAEFWQGFGKLVEELAPRNRQLLQQRDAFQAKIDAWHREYPDAAAHASDYKRFLSEIGYLVPEQGDAEITTSNVDAEIATIAGPQLVVPVMNARFALNAANARWGSLYDALYGSNVIPQSDDPATTAYDPTRGAQVIAYACEFLDKVVPLSAGSHAQASRYHLQHRDKRK